MGDKEIVNLNIEQTYLPIETADLSTPQAGEKTYRLANIYRVMFARLFDLLLSGTPGMVINSVVMSQEKYVGNWGVMSSVLISTLAWTIIYFVVIPWFLKGQTIGKLVFNIRLKRKGGDKKIKFWMLLAREVYFNIIPWSIVVIAQIISVLIMSKYQSDDLSQSPGMLAASLIINIANIVYVLWMTFVAITIKIQDHHQASLDLKFDLFVVYRMAIEDEQIITKNKNEHLSRDDKHVSLTDQPGNFDEQVIKDLYVSDEQEMKSSIYLEKDNLVDDLIIEKNRHKNIENKNDKKGNKDNE